MKMNNTSCNKQPILIGTIIILIVAIISLFVLLNSYFNGRLMQIQSVTSSNYERVVKIEGFLNQLIQQNNIKVKQNVPVEEEE